MFFPQRPLIDFLGAFASLRETKKYFLTFKTGIKKSRKAAISSSGFP